jgi:hypothetical protein
MANGKNGAGALKVVAALAGAAAAGYYFYGSKEAKTHRKIAAKWAGNMKSDVLKQAKKVKDLDRKTLEGIVVNAQKTYAGLKNMDRREVERAGRELKSNWQEVMKELGKGAASTKKTAAKAVKKSVKTVKKVTKKIA